jgi:hypothetical protein
MKKLQNLVAVLLLLSGLVLLNASRASACSGQLDCPLLECSPPQTCNIQYVYCSYWEECRQQEICVTEAGVCAQSGSFCFCSVCWPYGPFCN